MTGKSNRSEFQAKVERERLQAEQVQRRQQELAVAQAHSDAMAAALIEEEEAAEVGYTAICHALSDAVCV